MEGKADEEDSFENKTAFIFKPVQNALPEPEMITTRAPLSSLNDLAISASASNVGKSSAFNLSGLLSFTFTIPLSVRVVHIDENALEDIARLSILTCAYLDILYENGYTDVTKNIFLFGEHA
mmetsp:Transcript_26568/g.41233  ORF Transcript_26568/g.41233 Transcript_26568/m.41233 type:complete len:122 (+) Transcript_26568:961-1326(+)